MKTSVKWTLGCGGAAVLFFGLLTLLFLALFLSYQPDTAAQALCELGSQPACARFQDEAAMHGFVLFALAGSGVLLFGSFLIGGITLIALLIP